MDNIVLIGMPSAGKSSAGALLAERLGFAFVDSDLKIREAEGATLSEIIEKKGAEGFILVEERVNMSLAPHKTVIATGGSAVYSDKAMRHFQNIGTVVYLKIGAEEVKKRIPSFTARGVVMRGNITDAEGLYRERAPLYEKYAKITVACEGKREERIVEEIIAAVGR